MEDVLNTNKISKMFGKRSAVKDVCLHIHRGDIYCLIGQDGAGKTTLLNILAGLSYPSSGSISFFDYREKNIDFIMRQVGVLSDAPALYRGMTAVQNLQLKCKALGIRKNRDRILDLLKTVGLQEFADTKVKTFSEGMKQRLAIAMTLVSSPDLIILDEPIKGLDPQGISDIREIILRLNQENNITFLITSHILGEMYRIGTNFGIMHNGHLIQEMTKEELRNAYSQYVELKTSNNSKACTILDSLSINSYKVVDDESIWIYDCMNDSGRIAAAMEKHGISVLSINLHSTTLEEIYFGIMERKKC